MQKIFIVFGTRPEAIKLAPVIKLIEKRNFFEMVVCNTGQHKELVDDVLKLFNIQCTYSCKVMEHSQTLTELTNKLINSLKPILNNEKPNLVIVHGDTTTAFVASLLSFYMGIPIAHIEAGLRTNDIMNPYPEEINRKFIDMVSQYLFAPTEMAYKNLLNEKHKNKKIIITGNTVIDSLKSIIDPRFCHPFVDNIAGKRLVLCTLHRRELSFNNLHKILGTIKKIANEFNNDTSFIFPVHPEPSRARIIHDKLKNVNNIRLTESLSPYIFQNLLNLCYLVITDSGGIQEEASYLGKPLLLVRKKTERTESLDLNMQIVGIEDNDLYYTSKNLLNDFNLYKNYCIKSNVYGKGNAAKKITEFLESNV